MPEPSPLLTIADLAGVLKGLPRDAPLVLRVGGKLHPWTQVTAGYFSARLSERSVSTRAHVVVLVAGQAADEPKYPPAEAAFRGDGGRTRGVRGV
jgi:hypothetical protein